MRSYPNNSPEAAARIISACLLADSDLDESELESESLQTVYSAFGLSPAQFLEVLRNYLDDLRRVTSQPNARISLLDPERMNRMLDEIQDRTLRLNILAAALRVCKGDHALNEAEIALFRHIMHQWQMDLTDLEIEASLPGTAPAGGT